ncbi:MAG: metalloregulator ArsR/SmtB family transcription factor [Rikenellaceae bacterium]
MNNKEYKNNEEQVARYMKALAHPARVAIVRFLSSQECCYFGDIHEVLPIAKATVSQHLTELKNSGLIQGEIMPPKVKYCINKSAWNEAKELISSFMESINTEKKCCKE